MQRSTTSPDQYLDALPEPARADVVTLDKHISSNLAGLERVVWEGKFWGGSEQKIIGYGEYTQQNRSGSTVEWFIVGLALQKNYISVYVNAVEDNQYLVEKYADQFGKVKTGKSSITFKRLDDVDLDVLMEVVTKARKLMTSGA